MQKLILIFLSGSLISLFSSDKPAAAGEHINWMNLNEAASSLQKEKRPVLIDLYTSWCGWCKVMDKKTYSNKNVAQYVEEKFYPVKLNAESKDAIEWKGKFYHFSPDYRSNEFAVYLTQGRLEFPTTVIIPQDGGEPQAIPGYLEPKDFELIAKYFGEGGYGRIPFAEFQKNFKSSW
jgi:thioredoxin-related protein